MPKKQWSPEQKLQIVLEALKEERHIGEIASEYGVHASAIHRCKALASSTALDVFRVYPVESQGQYNSKEPGKKCIDSVGLNIYNNFFNVQQW